MSLFLSEQQIRQFVADVVAAIEADPDHEGSVQWTGGYAVRADDKGEARLWVQMEFSMIAGGGWWITLVNGDLQSWDEMTPF